MRPLSTRERLVLGLAAAIALATGLHAAVSRAGSPEAARLARLRREERGIAAELATLRSENAELRTEVERRLARGTGREAVQRMITTVQGAARSAGLRIDDLKPLPPERASGVERLPVQVTVSTGFHEAARFLYELGRNPNHRVDQLRITAADRATDHLQLEIRLVACVRAAEDGDEGGS